MTVRKVLSPLVSTTPGLKLQVQFEVPPGDPTIDAKVDAAKAALRDLARFTYGLLARIIL